MAHALRASFPGRGAGTCSNQLGAVRLCLKSWKPCRPHVDSRRMLFVAPPEVRQLNRSGNSTIRPTP
eukprot:13164981-Alexandrium_andersonii.AAC.1